MKKRSHNQSAKTKGITRFSRLLPGLLILALFLMLGSCEKGHDGWPGRAYVALSWWEHEPDYIELDNDYIPVVFYWDEYYRVAPGSYWIYYEGVHSRRGKLYEYAWDLEYEVWENPGEQGKPFKDGLDGSDGYFTIELAPDGPEVYYEEFYPAKSATDGDNAGIILHSDDEIIIEKHSNNFSLRVKHRKVDPRPAGI